MQLDMETEPVERDPELERFEIELEFVQCLCNPHYLNFLAQRGYFRDSAFINYLTYLLYWKQPEYIKFLRYPQALKFLELLQEEQFRKELANADKTRDIDYQVLLSWHHYTKKQQEAAEKIAKLAATLEQGQN